MSAVTIGSFHATASRSKIRGWIVEVWEDGHSGPVCIEEFDHRPSGIEKRAVLQRLIQGRRDAEKAKDEWDDWNRRADEESARAYRAADRPPKRPSK